MAKKKRRDEKRDPSSAKRVLKAGKAALAVGAGAVLFSRTGLLKKSSEIIPALMDTKKTFDRSLLGKKRTALNLYEAYNEAIGPKGKVIKETLKKAKPIDGKIKYDPRTSRTTNFLGIQKNIKQTSSNDLPQQLWNDYKIKMRDKMKEGIKKDKRLTSKYSDEVLDDIVEKTFAKYQEISKVSGDDVKVSTDFLKHTKEMYNISSDDLEDIVERTSKFARKRLDDNARRKVIKDSENFIEQVKQVKYDNLKKKTRDNKFINKIGKKIGIDDLEDLIFKSRQATVKEVLDNLEKLGLDPNDFSETIKNRVHTKGHENDHLINSLREVIGLNHHGDYDDVIFDKYLRVKGHDDNLEFIDTTRSVELFEGIKKKFDSTIVGRVLTKGIDIQGIMNAPKSYILHGGLRSAAAWLDYTPEEIANKTGGSILKESKIVIDGAAYSFSRDEIYGFELGEKVAEGFSLNMRHGSFSGVLKNILGTGKKDPLNSTNRFLQKLDIGQTGRPNFFNRVTQWWNKFDNPDWERNIIDRARDFLLTEGSAADKAKRLAAEMGISETDAMARIYEDLKVVRGMWKNRASSSVFDDDAAARLHQTIKDLVDKGGFGDDSDLNRKLTKIQELLDLVVDKQHPEEMFDKMLELKYNGTIFNSNNLSELLDRYQSNSASALEMISIESQRTKKIPIISMELAETNVLDSAGILRQEIIKEITTEEDIMSVVKSTMTMDSDFEAFELLTHWQKWDTLTNVPDKDELFTGLFAAGGKLDNLIGFARGSDYDAHMTNSFLLDFRSNYGFLHKGTFNGMHEDYAQEYQTYDFVSKSKIGMDLIKDANNLTKLKNAGKEFIAGRHDLQNVTPATLVTQYMVNRLSMGVEEVGLGLSSASLGSPLSAIKNMMLKRVAPAMIAYTAFDYLNDRSQDVTGVGITGAMANVAANFDVAGRKLAYATGIGQALDWFKRTSVIGEYWTGSTDFQTAEERSEWYREGYSPVRKSRFWGFGSASEFRGGDISFFQPNYLRRIHSDYKDKVLYGSNSEKWAHSIIPTPTHPFSTVRYLLDPYWLEKKHIDDAPTPLTGKMFSEGSFWGAILNPTVGQVIKPQIMLPEIKKRLSGKGHDVKGILRRINERTKRKASEYDDMLVVNGTDIRNATYVPYGNATPDTITINQNGEIRGANYMDTVQNIGMYRTPDGTTYTEKSGGGFGPPVTRQMETGGVIKNTVDDFIGELGKQSKLSTDIVQKLNEAIKNKNKTFSMSRGRQGGPSYASQTPNASYEGTYYYNNLVNEYNNYMTQYYSDKLDPAMVNKGIYSDLMADAKHSAKNLSGIYGFLGEQFFGEDSYTLRYENAGSYSSFSRGFWDAGIGGLGGGTMEIARRFFPSTDKSRIDYNPLVNNMPEWLPDKFHYGVPWTKVTKGEMRLPGKGYEALNELHPDEFADENGYGSFDKFKILADVAPNSNEYKIWHNIVKHNIKDPELKEEIKEIEARTKRMAGSHEFYEYQYLHTGTQYENGIVKTINEDGTVTLSDNKVLTLAGIEFNNNYGGEIHNFLKPGQKIAYRTETNVVNDPTGEGVIRKAAIYTNKHGETLSKQLMDMGVADRDMSDTSAIGNLATISSTQETWGAVQEIIAHARIPIVHNKLMHIETPLESFISEQVYGANFQTWDHPIEGFVKPMINETIGQNIIQRALARGYREFHYSKVLTKPNLNMGSRTTKFMSGVVMATLDPAAMLGGTAGTLLRLNNGRNGDGRQKLGAFSTGAKIGGLVGDAAWAWGQADDPLSGAIAFGALAGDLYRKLELGEFAEKVFNKNIKLKTAMAIGAGIGVGVSAIKNADFDKDRLFGKHMPKKYKKINEMNEYFDRLEYIKYKGLYEAAARKAALLEDANIKDIFNELDKNKKKIAKLKHKAEKLLDKYDEGDSEYKAKMAEIQQKISSLQESGNNVFKGGKYTKSAVAYKKAMESTIYGLSEGATKDEILAAIPDQYKDYFQKFMDVRDEKEQKKILEYMPEYLKRPLQLAWGMKLSDIESNRKYFKTHKLPSLNWRGWKPNINLKHVQMKTVQNEGMLLADFGFYESEKGKAAYTVAPDIENYDKGERGFSMFRTLRLAAEMKGLGLGLTNVSIDRTSAPGMWISADIKQSIEDRTEITSVGLSNTLQSLASNFI